MVAYKWVTCFLLVHLHPLSYSRGEPPTGNPPNENGPQLVRLATMISNAATPRALLHVLQHFLAPKTQLYC